MSLSHRIKEAIRPYHLLQHPFYQAWNEGEISRDTLKEYAAQYYSHVEAFPRYISATHSQCENMAARQLLLENLNDEEGAQGKPHPELWLQFAEKMGNTREQVLQSQRRPSIENVIGQFFKSARSSYVEGLCSLYAYEYQVPEIAETKIRGLVDKYGVSEKEALEFFEVHKTADVYHREACEKLIDQISPEEEKKAIAAAKQSAEALWNFLSDMWDYQNAA